MNYMRQANKAFWLAFMTLIFSIMGVSGFVEATDNHDEHKKAICHATGNNGGFVYIEPANASSHLSHGGGLKHGDVWPVDGKCPTPEIPTTIETPEVPTTTETPPVTTTPTTVTAPEIPTPIVETVPSTIFPEDTQPVTPPPYIPVVPPEEVIVIESTPEIVTTTTEPITTTTEVTSVPRRSLPATGNASTIIAIIACVLILVGLSARRTSQIRRPWRND